MRTKGEPRRVERPAFLTRSASGPADRSAGIAHAVNVLKATARS